jgi:carbon-monoxide dehydrogenase medium subunit
MWNEYYSPASLQKALEILAEEQGAARIVAGATDLLLELERGARKEIRALVDITRIAGLDEIRLDESDVIHLGPLVTHNHCAGSALLRDRAYPLMRAAWKVGAPQIRNRGTVAGNLITASPANDTISPLMALDARVTLASTRGERVIPLREFYTGVRKTVMRPDEMLVDIAFPAMKANQRGTFLKLGQRRAQAISVVNVAVILTMEGETIVDAAITLGAVAPTIIHAEEAEKFLAGKSTDDSVFEEAARLAMEASRPIDDIRGSAAYRREMVRVLTLRALKALRDGTEKDDTPPRPILLWGKAKESTSFSEDARHGEEDVIRTTINGKSYTFTGAHDKTLLQLIRDYAGLTGPKEGCGEGECGACTVYLDGKAVMSCLVPAPRAHGAEIVTIEGLANQERFQPVQEAFVHDGAVQCGYCTPGFIMSAAKLLEERPDPTKDEIRQAITGNLCRCTGYTKIVQAIEDASKKG